MKTLGRFSYRNPSTLDEVFDLLEEFPGKCQLLAGGTDLLVMIRKRLRAPAVVVDVKGIPELHRVSVEADAAVSIGAAATVAELEKEREVSELYPAFSQVYRLFGNAQIRNRATVGGNICRSSPAGDTLPVLLVYDAQVELASRAGTRTVPLASFFTGPGQNVLEPGELLTRVLLPAEGRTGGAAYHKVMRTTDDLAKINTAARLVLGDGTIQTARVAVGSVAPTPKRLARVEQALVGAPATEASLEAALAVATEEMAPLTDVRSTREYRLTTTPTFLRRVLDEAVKEATQ